MQQSKLFSRVLTLLCAWLMAADCFGIGEELIDRIMRSDFIFDRELSNAPFIPLGYLQYSNKNSIELGGDCGANVPCEFSYDNLSQGFGLPLWVGQKHMFIVGETLEVDRFKTRGRDITIKSGGILAAWVMQPSESLQAGAFFYRYANLGSSRDVEDFRGEYYGAVARYRHSSKFHSYWGLVRHKENNENLLFPYAGFDWYIDQYWVISAILPWPAVNYAPDRDTLFRIGALYSGSSWINTEQDELAISNFSQWDFGFSYERRIHSMWWGELSIGKSGFGNYSIESDSSIHFDAPVEKAYFARLSLNLRP